MPCARGRHTGRILARLAAVWVICCGFAPSQWIWQRIGKNISEQQIERIVFQAGSQPALIAATQNGIYRSDDHGLSFHQLFSFSKQQRVYSISIHPDDFWIGVATDSGLYESPDAGSTWQKTVEPADALEKRCYAVFRQRDEIFAGTAQGLFVRAVSQTAWRRFQGGLGRMPVYDIQGNDACVFVAVGDGIYRWTQDDTGRGQLKKIFAVAADEADADFDEEDAGDLYDVRFVRDLEVYGEILFVVTQAGIWQSSDAGDAWQQMNTIGLALDQAQKLYPAKSCLTSHGQRASEFQQAQAHAEPEPALFLATDNGVFFGSDSGWRQLYQGLPTNRIFDIADDGAGNIVLAADAGLFALRRGTALRVRPEEIARAFEHEPDVRRVQEMVIRYADVSKSKIDRWHKQSRAKSFLPSLSLGLDRDASDLYHWDTGASPDELQKGREMVAWDVSLSWDLSDFVWSSAQTSIDSRSKLMVELREDLLDQVTRLYFERRRLQAQFLAAEQEQNELGDWEVQLRIEELTAMIDAMTGGEFSREIERVKSEE